MNNLYEILEKLIACQSVTPLDAGCQDLMIDFLNKIGYVCVKCDKDTVSNFYAYKGTPLIMFAGHTDVVPVGTGWESDPFKLTQKKDTIVARGVADMKGSLAAMLMTAWELKDYQNIGFLITSGEEGQEFLKGTPHVLEILKEQGLLPKYCIVGEPSSQSQLADTIKIGRRGSLSADINILGVGGHVAYPQYAKNPIHHCAELIKQLSNFVWDEGDKHFPPSTLQITDINSNNNAENVIPTSVRIKLNIRFSPLQTASSLQAKIEEILNNCVNYKVNWRLNGLPFLTKNGKLLDAATIAIEKITARKPNFSTSGGTSDARFIAPYGIEVIELGPCNKTIHQACENIRFSELDELTKIYIEITKQLLS